MKKTFFILLTICFSFQFVQAQIEKHYIKFRSSDANMRLAIPVRFFFIESIVDGRTGDTSRVGIVKKGLAGNQTDALMDKGVISSFHKLIDMNTLNVKREARQEPIIMQIKELEVSELTLAGSETGRLEMTLAFYKKHSDSLSYIFTAEIIEEGGGGTDATSSHPLRIKKGLQKALFRLQDFLDGSTNSSFYSDTDEEFKNNIKEYDLKIKEYNKDSLTTYTPLNIKRNFGIYLSFDDFMRNQPKIITNFSAEYELDKSSVKLFSNTNKKLLKGRFFAFCNDDDIYIYDQNYTIGRRFVNVLEKGTIMAWKDLVFDERDVNRQVLFSSGGLVGGLVGAAISPKRDRDCVILDTRTGLFKVMKVKDVEILLANDKEILNLYNLAPKRNNANTILEMIKEYNKKYPIK